MPIFIVPSCKIPGQYLVKTKKKSLKPPRTLRTFIIKEMMTKKKKWKEFSKLIRFETRNQLLRR